MTRRDPNAGSRQAGGYRSDEQDWDSPRQASQWQAEGNRQAGGSGWEADTEERTDYFDRGRTFEGRYPGDPAPGQSRERGYQGDRSRGDRSTGQGYRFSGVRGEGAHAFDASGGNDFRSFTSEDYGKGDFSQSSSSGITGGLHPSDTYRPSYGPGSWGRHRDSDDEQSSWRAYGESRGFLKRAGDEVASWFGDEDAARRREADHRGRGPSDYVRSDERIREDVNDTLTHDWRLDASHVRVAVAEGEVTLEGTVDTRQEKRRAEDLADDVSGVRHVQNNLRLTSTASVATPRTT